LQNDGFGAFLEAKVFNQSSGIFSNFDAEKQHLRQAAALVSGHCTEDISKIDRQTKWK
jgi:hypothetical protein